MTMKMVMAALTNPKTKTDLTKIGNNEKKRVKRLVGHPVKAP
jgi:hypothetical protein